MNNTNREFEDLLEDQFEVEDDTYFDKAKRKAQRRMNFTTSNGLHQWIGLLLNMFIMLTSLRLLVVWPAF